MNEENPVRKEILTALQKLREPFPENLISLLPKPTKKDAPKSQCKECGGWHGQPAVHLKYVGHAALTHRLLDVDPFWNWEPLAMTPEGLPRFDESGGLWIKLKVAGMERLGYGNAQGASFKDIGSREKEVIGDALRNAAMRFGAALDLWHKGDLHAGDEPDELEKEVPQVQVTKPIAQEDKDKNVLNQKVRYIYDLAKKSNWTEDQLKKVLKFSFNVGHVLSLNKNQYDHLCEMLKAGMSPQQAMTEPTEVRQDD